VTCDVTLGDNLFPVSIAEDENCRDRLCEIFSVTTHIGMIRRRATAVCIGLQDLDLPALVTLEVIDADCDNDIRMWAKWELITTVKHFHDRQHTKKTLRRVKIKINKKKKKKR
jgi:hypothetical protein